MILMAYTTRLHTPFQGETIPPPNSDVSPGIVPRFVRPERQAKLARHRVARALMQLEERSVEPELQPEDLDSKIRRIVFLKPFHAPGNKHANMGNEK